MDLWNASLNEVEVFYKTDVSIVGKLGMLGDRIKRAKAKSERGVCSGSSGET